MLNRQFPLAKRVKFSEMILTTIHRPSIILAAMSYIVPELCPLI